MGAVEINRPLLNAVPTDYVGAINISSGYPYRPEACELLRRSKARSKFLRDSASVQQAA
jgi:hypothetical protein